MKSPRTLCPWHRKIRLQTNYLTAENNIRSTVKSRDWSPNPPPPWMTEGIQYAIQWCNPAPNTQLHTVPLYAITNTTSLDGCNPRYRMTPLDERDPGSHINPATECNLWSHMNPVKECNTVKSCNGRFLIHSIQRIILAMKVSFHSNHLSKRKSRNGKRRSLAMQNA